MGEERFLSIIVPISLLRLKIDNEGNYYKLLPFTQKWVLDRNRS